MLMIIRYYKGNISSYQLREYSKTNRFGTTAYHIIETLKYLGFEASGLDICFEKIREEKITFPCIAHMKIGDEYHYIVLYKINDHKQQILIADPSHKIKYISFVEFQKDYNNVLIVMHPIRKIPLYYNYRIIFKFTLQKMYTYRNYILKILLLSILITVFSIVLSFYLKFMIDAISISSYSLLSKIFIVFLIINVLKIIADYFRNQLLIYLNHHLDYDLTENVFQRILSLPYSYFKNRTTGEVISRIQDLGKVRDMISKLSLSLSIDFLLVILSSIVLMILNKRLFLGALVILSCYIIILCFFQSKLSQGVKNIRQENSLVHSYMIECLTGIENIKGLNLIEKFGAYFNQKYKTYIRHMKNLNQLYNGEYFFKECIQSIGLLFILYGGGKLVIQGSITLGELLSFYTLLFYFLDPIRNLIDLNILLYESKHAFIRIDEILEEKKKIKGQKVDKIYQIEFHNLSYSIDDHKRTLKNINLTWKKNDFIILVGSSGSGKSTLLKILKGYYPISDEMIYINQKEYNQYKNIGDKIAYISQNEMLYTGTLYENLKLHREVKIEDIEKVCKICCIDDFIIKDQFHYFIEENGFNLSGGERQRIVLARALLNEFDILIIDESLNQVDVNLERKILKNIKQEYYYKMIIFVSHRYENVDLFDSFVQLEDGSILKKYSKNK